MAVVIGKPNILLEDLLSQVSEFEILHYYFGVSVLPYTINSPLRKDNHASVGIYTKDGVTVRWVDYATNEYGGLFDLLEKYWGLNYQDTINRIYTELPQIKGSDSHNMLVYKSSVRTLDEYRSNVDMKCKTREWQAHDLAYWSSYGISLDWLKFADIYPVEYKIIIKNGVQMNFPVEKYAYVYVEFKEGKTTLKLYQPFSKQFKWSNKHDRSVISLWTKVPEFGEKICICSSTKDALCLWANTGIPSIAVQGEGYGISESAQNELKRRYKKIYILFDNDETGLKDGVMLSNDTGFTNLVLPQFEGGKDISDLMKAQGAKKFNEIILPLFQ